jgi:NAD(P)-dependent dehydrogenase (short-subunit alcohol dehydrogenase family)
MNKPKTILITGATSGIGLEAARVLACKGHKLIGTGRSAERCEKARLSILESCPQAQIRFEIADFSSLEAVRRLGACAREITAVEGLDILVNNAGQITEHYTPTPDGYETQFAVNHLAPFLLTHELLPVLQKAGQARVINVSSRSHRFMRIFWGDVMLRRFYNVLLAYKQSKLANVLFTFELNRRFASENGLRAYALHPGLVNTSIGLKGTKGVAHKVWKKRGPKGVSPQKGAETIIHLADTEHLADPLAAVSYTHLTLPTTPYV